MSRHQHRWSEHDETDEAPERRTCSDCGLTEVTFAAALRRAEIVAAAMADQGPGRPKVAIVGSFD